MRARTAPRRAAGTALGAVLAAALTFGLGAAPAAAAPPADPIQQAQEDADAVVDRIGALSAELAGAQADVSDARARAAIALDDYQAAQVRLTTAQAAAEQAAAAAARAAAAVQEAHDALVAFARRSFMARTTAPGVATLITSDPADLAERAALLEAAGAHRSDEVMRFTAARDQADIADAAARAALDAAGALQRQAAEALTVAAEAERAARLEAQAVAARQAGLGRELDLAQDRLAALIGPQQAADRIARRLASFVGPVLDPVGRTEAGPGSAEVARAAVDAATAVLGTQYSWGGGGPAGPGRGIDLDRDVVGFDCSSLAQYAYAQAGVDIPRNSRGQFANLPKVARSDLRSGDLVFWATDPTDPDTIHHVAIWLGGGEVLQAPQSGDVVKISTMWWSGYAGAVRPSAL